MTVDRRFGGLMLVVTVLVAAAGWGLSALLVGAADAADTGVQCRRVQTPPAPPAGGAVFARRLVDSSPGPNVVIVPAGHRSDEAGSCAIAGSAATVISHPESIVVGAGGAVLFGDGTGLWSPWGAKDVALGQPTPVLTSKGFLGGPDWVPTDAQVVDPGALLRDYLSCRDCSLANATFTAFPPNGMPGPDEQTNVAFTGQLQGADLRGAHLHGHFHRWDLDRADLTGAKLSGVELSASTLDHTTVSGTDFDGDELDGTRMTALRAQVPPSFAGVKIGDEDGACTVLKDSDLVGAKLTIAGTTGCAGSPLVPGSRLSLGAVADIRHQNLSGARFVATAGDRHALAGANLSGVNLSGASFIGFPADLMKTNFDNASLAGTSFELAHLAGATFRGADLNGASFSDADLASRADLPGANFAGKQTNLTDAVFVDADISGASFSGALLSGASFSRALAVDTDFSGVRAPGADFNGAHIYGNGRAFHDATNLNGVSFSGAVLAGDVDDGGGFDFADADLTDAVFDRAQCVNCEFTGATLTHANFTGAYLPGATFASATSLMGARLFNAWLYCGDQSNSSCAPIDGTTNRWAWPLALGSSEAYGPVPFADSDFGKLPAGKLDNVGDCPDGKAGSTQPVGCAGHLLPDPAQAPTLPAPCSSAAADACPTRTSTVLDAAKLGTPLAIVGANPATWANTVSQGGTYAGFDDGTIRQIVSGRARLIAGDPKRRCPASTDPCGDGGPATDALLGDPAGLAVGLHGSVYVADPGLHRVRRIDPSGTIVTIAGDGSACAVNNPDCGDGGPATKAKLAGPYGVWVSPGGQVYIADGADGVREVLTDGTIVSARVGYVDARSVVGDADGRLYAAGRDRIVTFTPGDRGSLTPVVGTGTTGYNGNTDTFGAFLPGTKVMVDRPQSLTIGLDGDLIFADTGNDLVRAYVPSSGHVINLAGSVVDDVPRAGFNDDGHWADETELDHPQGVAATRDGLFIVADSGNKRVRRFGPNPSDETRRR